MYKKEKLDNGLKLVTHHMPQRQSLSLGIWIKVGGRYENVVNKGISHLLEHLLFKGSRKYSCRRIKESIEGIGGSLNGFTSEELTCYLVKIPAEYAHKALDVLSDMVINPQLPALELAKEKPVILEEIKMYKDLPQSYVHELLDELLWPEQPIGMPIIGSVESVSRASLKELALFKERHYTSSNITVAAAGRLEDDKLKNAVHFAFGGLKKQSGNVFSLAREKQFTPALKVFNKDTEQTHLALGFHAFKRDHRLKHALGLLHIVLGANMSSRLFNELREKRGLAYRIGTQVKLFADTGAFVVQAGIDNSKVTRALPLILKELKKITLKPVKKDEFRRAKEFYIGQLKLGLEDTLDHMLWMGETAVTLDKVYSEEEIIKGVRKVAREDIEEAARCIFQQKKINLALVGPIKEKEEKILRQLQL